MVKRPTVPHTGSTTALYRYLRKIGAAAACLALMSLLSACVEQGETSAGKSRANDKVLRYDVNAPFTSLYPAAVKASGSTHIFPLLYSYLFVPGTEGELIPDLAVRWAFDADKRQWTIHLRNNARFHNDRLVTASDVKFSLEVHISRIRPDLKSSIERIIATSDVVLTLLLKHDDPFILNKLWDIEIVPHTKNKKPGEDFHPIGSGPFKFAHRQGNQMVTLEANANYYGGPPALDRIVFYYQPDREQAWTRLLSGATDIAHEISPQNYHITHQYNDRFYFDTYTMRFYTILLYNTHDPLFSDTNVRKALTLGIDRKYIVEHILNGFGSIAAGPMGLDSSFGNPRAKPMPFAPARAVRLLNQAGWFPDETGRLKKDGRPFEFTIFVFRESDIEKKVAQFIQLCLNNLGINTIVRALDYEDIKKSYFQNSQFQAVLTEIEGAYRIPDTIKMLWSTGDHGKAYAAEFNHQKVNHLIDKAFGASDPAERQKTLHKVDGLIHSLQPGTFLFHKTALDTMSRRFHLPHPFSLTCEGIYRLKDLSINKDFSP